MKQAVTAAPVLRIALYEGAGSQPLAGAARAELLRALLEKGYAVTCVKPGAPVSSIFTGELLVLGQFDEEKPAEAEAADGKLALHFRQITGLDTSAVLDLVEQVRETANAAKPGGWKPWFPVIDYDRCTNCMQCLSFCLFDVYGVNTGGRITVQKSHNCKTDCPACSRVCPEVAILFPKYKSGPINGDVVKAEDMQREKMKVDISALLGGDIYAALKTRSADAKVRFSKERDEKRALEERKRCLTKLQQALDIPAEVMASLPSLEQIQSKAAAARAVAVD
ncbi:MAG TPA: ferredoxin family protein [Tepidisphaeraceae bacterium]|jgi:NAD-dependent dihydropyrimidine dehydrogenase PreA subunit|nr:ferredoxin family protein [Tepidisphaeraceae bacterium]